MISVGTYTGGGPVIWFTHFGIVKGSKSIDGGAETDDAVNIEANIMVKAAANVTSFLFMLFFSFA